MGVLQIIQLISLVLGLISQINNSPELKESFGLIKHVFKKDKMSFMDSLTVIRQGTHILNNVANTPETQGQLAEIKAIVGALENTKPKKKKLHQEE